MRHGGLTATRGRRSPQPLLFGREDRSDNGITQFELAITAAHQASMKHGKQRMSMRSGNARYSACERVGGYRQSRSEHPFECGPGRAGMATALRAIGRYCARLLPAS